MRVQLSALARERLTDEDIGVVRSPGSYTGSSGILFVALPGPGGLVDSSRLGTSRESVQRLRRFFLATGCCYLRFPNRNPAQVRPTGRHIER